MSKNKIQNKLTEEELEQLRCWVSATPLQRLEWLEEAQRIAERSGALQRYENSQIKEAGAEYISTNKDE